MSKISPPRSILSAGVVAALGVILIILAVLQYRWIGQVSEADRERMQISLNASVRQFRQDFQRELGRIATTFRIDPRLSANREWTRYAERYDEWMRTATHPQLVESVYLWEFDGGGSELARLDPETMDLRPASWPPGWEALRGSLEDEAGELAKGGRDFRLRMWTLDERIPALVHTLVRFGGPPGAGDPPQPRIAGYLLVELDLAYLQKTLLPELARRHFGAGEGLPYRVAVVSKENPSEPLYDSEPGLPAEMFTSSDARIELLGRPDSLPPPGPPEGGPGGFRGFIAPREEGGRWELVVRHRLGSLDAVVSGARRRSLAVSFGVLLLLAGAMAMIILSTQRAQRLARLQIDFVAGVSHELRTPLAVISSAADNLAEGVVDPRLPVRQYGALIRNESRRLREMVEQILLFAAERAGRRYELRPVAVDAVVNNTLAEARSVIEEAGVSVETKIDAGLAPALADEAALKQCLQNLVNNALKYGAGGRWLGLEATAHGPEIRITVADKGMGIDESDLRHIFDPFYRGKAAKAAQIHGTGLGLSLARDFAEAMGGRITVESAPDKGSSFTLHLPAAAPHDRPLEKTA